MFELYLKIKAFYGQILENVFLIDANKYTHTFLIRGQYIKSDFRYFDNFLNYSTSGEIG